MRVDLKREEAVVTAQRNDIKLLLNYILLDRGSYSRAYEVADRIQTMLAIKEMAEKQEIYRLVQEEREKANTDSEKLMSASA